MRSRVVVAVGGVAKVGCAPKKIVAAVIEAIEPASTLRTENFFVLFTCIPTYVSRTTPDASVRRTVSEQNEREPNFD
ncbi:unannotated protein [freshwater metagenome]|uniref:Unannotated protein n=1 Tax=freshwater metagenome TaxID=449393 RepID=A0A6J6YZ48_9ZZZZ